MAAPNPQRSAAVLWHGCFLGIVLEGIPELEDRPQGSPRWIGSPVFASGWFSAWVRNGRTREKNRNKQSKTVSASLLFVSSNFHFCPRVSRDMSLYANTVARKELRCREESLPFYPLFFPLALFRQSCGPGVLSRSEASFCFRCLFI